MSDAVENNRFWSHILHKSTVPTMKRMNRFLVQNLPIYIREKHICTAKDLEGLEDKTGNIEEEISELEDWKEKTDGRIKSISKELDKLEAKGGKS